MRKVDEFLIGDGCKFDKMRNYDLDYVVEHIKNNMSQSKLINQGDKPWWTKSSTELFSVKIVWELVIHKEDTNIDLKRLWCKNPSLEFSFII